MIDRRGLLTLLASAALAPGAGEAAGPHPTITLWSVLQAARQDIPAGTEPEDIDYELTEAVAARLTAGGKAVTLAFATGLVETMERANRWDLWGAGYVIHGGMSDDSFAYFRTWLIGQGRGVFDQALADPDSLAETIPQGREGALDLEGLLFAPQNAWEEIHAEADRQPGFPELHVIGGEPTGDPFDEKRPPRPIRAWPPASVKRRSARAGWPRAEPRRGYGWRPDRHPETRRPTGRHGRESSRSPPR